MEQPNADQPPTHRMTIPDAARALGLTSEAVRGRVKRGTLPSERADDGTVYVLVEGDQVATDHQPTADPPRDQSELVDELRDRIESLERQLEDANTRDRENRRLLAAALERMPELESHEQREGRDRSDPGDAQEDHSSEPSPEAHSGSQRPWWRRWFGK